MPPGRWYPHGVTTQKTIIEFLSVVYSSLFYLAIRDWENNIKGFKKLRCRRIKLTYLLNAVELGVFEDAVMLRGLWECQDSS